MIAICSLFEDQERTPSDFYLDHLLVNTVVNIYDANPRDMTSDRLYCETEVGSEWLNLPTRCDEDDSDHSHERSALARVQVDDTLYSAVTINNCTQENIEVSCQVYMARNLLTNPPSRDIDTPVNELVTAVPIDPLARYVLPLYFAVPDEFVNCCYQHLTSALKLHAIGVTTGLEITDWIPIFNYIQVDRYSVYA